MPALSYHFGLSPDDIWGLTHDELKAYRKGLREIQEEADG